MRGQHLAALKQAFIAAVMLAVEQLEPVGKLFGFVGGNHSALRQIVGKLTRRAGIWQAIAERTVTRAVLKRGKAVLNYTL